VAGVCGRCSRAPGPLWTRGRAAPAAPVSEPFNASPPHRLTARLSSAWWALFGIRLGAIWVLFGILLG
jgi:hypothetical protein